MSNKYNCQRCGIDFVVLNSWAGDFGYYFCADCYYKAQKLIETWLKGTAK